MQTPRALKKTQNNSPPIVFPRFAAETPPTCAVVFLSAIYSRRFSSLFLCGSLVSTHPHCERRTSRRRIKLEKVASFFSAWRPALIIGPPAESVKVTSRRLWHCLFFFFGGKNCFCSSDYRNKIHAAPGSSWWRRMVAIFHEMYRAFPQNCVLLCYDIILLPALDCTPGKFDIRNWFEIQIFRFFHWKHLLAGVTGKFAESSTLFSARTAGFEHGG